MDPVYSQKGSDPDEQLRMVYTGIQRYYITQNISISELLFFGTGTKINGFVFEV